MGKEENNLQDKIKALRCLGSQSCMETAMQISTIFIRTKRKQVKKLCGAQGDNKPLC